MNDKIPFVVEIPSSGNVVTWVDNHKDDLEFALDKYGAVLICGCTASDESQFRDVVDICCGQALKYVYRSTPRADLGGNIYTATEYPSGLKIPFHNENAFQREWPLVLLFYCVHPADGGGGLTPLADIESVTHRIDRTIRKKFFERKITYIRNYSKNVDLPWQVVFQTDSRQKVDEFCLNQKIVCEWRDNGNLRTRQTCDSFAKNPRTGKAVWFNQAHLFHPSSLDRKTRELLGKVFQEDEFPRNATFGDGTALDETELEHIRHAYEAEEVQFQWKSGDILILDNMRIAHSRTPYKGNRRVLAAMGRSSSNVDVAVTIDECL
jgi:hypothetical protein